MTIRTQAPAPRASEPDAPGATCAFAWCFSKRAATDFRATTTPTHQAPSGSRTPTLASSVANGNRDSRRTAWIRTLGPASRPQRLSDQLLGRDVGTRTTENVPSGSVWLHVSGSERPRLWPKDCVSYSQRLQLRNVENHSLPVGRSWAHTREGHRRPGSTAPAPDGAPLTAGFRSNVPQGPTRRANGCGIRV